MEKHNYFIRLQEKTETAPEAYKSHNLIKLFEILFEHQDRKGLPIKLGQEILGKEVKSECFGELLGSPLATARTLEGARLDQANPLVPVLQHEKQDDFNFLGIRGEISLFLKRTERLKGQLTGGAHITTGGTARVLTLCSPGSTVSV